MRIELEYPPEDMYDADHYVLDKLYAHWAKKFSGMSYVELRRPGIIVLCRRRRIADREQSVSHELDTQVVHRAQIPLDFLRLIIDHMDRKLTDAELEKPI